MLMFDVCNGICCLLFCWLEGITEDSAVMAPVRFVGRRWEWGRWLAEPAAGSEERGALIRQEPTHNRARAYRPLRSCLTAAKVQISGHLFIRLCTLYCRHYCKGQKSKQGNCETKILKTKILLRFFQGYEKMILKMPSLSNNSSYLCLPIFAHSCLSVLFLLSDEQVLRPLGDIQSPHKSPFLRCSAVVKPVF